MEIGTLRRLTNLVSIIVPVYNAESTLRRCIESILNQEYRDIELILVNDGSSDSSAEICDEYAEKDLRVKVIHKENTGVSDSRNVGIRMATGDYLQFVDADDWITSEATKLMVREATQNQCELVITDFYRVIGKRVAQKGSIKESGILTREELAENIMENPADFYYGVLWNKLYRRDIVFEHQIKMDERISWCEDFLFNLEYILHINRISILQVPTYYYLKNDGSLVSQSKNISKVVRTKLRIFEFYNEFYKNVYDEKAYAKKRLGIYRYLIDAAGDGGVMPGIFTNSSKLGEESIPIAEQVVSEDDHLTVIYRNIKLLERYYHTIGLKYDLTYNDIKLLAHLAQMPVVKSRKELADYAGMPLSTVSRSLQKMRHKHMIEVSKEPEHTIISIAEEGTPVLLELQQAFNDYDEVRFRNFSEDEIGQYLQYQKRINQNLSRILSPTEVEK